MRSTFFISSLPGVASGLVFLVVGGAYAAEITASGRDYFESHIRPVLIAECYDCHAGGKKQGGLALDSREGLRKGGDSGVGLVPGNAAESLLIQTLAHSHKDVDLHMPKDGAKLDTATFKHFVEWVNMGAPDPRDESSVAEGGQAVSWDQIFALRKQWWSFLPVDRAATPPQVPGSPMHPVDGFVLAKLQEQGLTPAPEADPRTRLRRLSYALTGLPPRPEETAAFLADTSPTAWEKMVDHYLSLPAYGEKWARHWMDLMRYAETHGSEGDPVIPGAWHYRDYLIRAFNQDLPYDQFVSEHLAGDLLAPRWNDDLGINESLLGTAHLRLVEHGFQPVDSLDEQVKTVDNQIDVITKSFLGLTVSCARCHDHKFDAISQKDFFALYGILASTRPGQVVLDRPEHLAMHRETLVDLKAGIKAELARLWLKEAENLPAVLLTGTPGRDLKEVRDAEHRLAGLRGAARARVAASQGAALDGSLLHHPMAAWDFEKDANDVAGALHGELLGGAKVHNGRLVLNGEDAYVRTAPLPKNVTDRTLEAWVVLDDKEQRGGGVVTIETEKGDVFDGIVFGEKRPGEWLAGSDNFRRTKDAGGPPEHAPKGRLVHVAVVYSSDHSVALYRDGLPYGQSYVAADEIQTYAAGRGHILLGKRHLGGGRSFLKGEIEEARLYDRALSRAEIAASFNAGAVTVSEEKLVAALSPVERQEYQELTARLKSASAAATEDARAAAWTAALDDAGRNASSVLHPWVKLRHRAGASFSAGWSAIHSGWTRDLQKRREFNARHFTTLWDVSDPTKEDYRKWFKQGTGMPLAPSGPGEFMVEPLAAGNLLLRGILPGGVYSPLLSSKHAAVFTSPFFKMSSDAVSLQLTGDHGGGVRLMVDNYPLGNNSTYPQFRPAGEPLRWIKLDTTYRKDSQAYVELTTRDDSTRPQPPTSEPAKRVESAVDDAGRSWFGVGRIVLHKDTPEPPKDEVLPVSWLMQVDGAPADAAHLAHLMGQTLTAAILAWQAGELSPIQQAYLNAFVSQGLLPVEADASPKLSGLAAAYRKLENEIPLPRRAPGPLEGEGYEAPLMERGDHLKLGDPVPRHFLSALGGADCTEPGSGRMKLADAMTDRSNPLLARVMVNRLWHWLFGKGLVGTVDNFGRLGDKPSHPELLDYLAARFEDEGYSVKRMVRLLLTTRTWQQRSEASPEAAAKDAANLWFSRARVQRLEAEMIRDGMLRISGQLDETLYGEPVGDVQRRRSLYLKERRNAPHAFLEVFDRPKPMTTRGQRDVTNIPAQSLTLMNDRFVLDLALRWARQYADTGDGFSFEQKVTRIYETAFTRPPLPAEVEAAREYLGGDESVDAWKDYLQAVFALKEFVYLR